MLFVRGTCRPYSFLICAIALLLSLPVLAQQRVVVGLVSDGALERFSGRQQLYTDELFALTSAEFDVELKVFQ